MKQETIEMQEDKEERNFIIDLDKTKSIAIVGSTDTGKTNLAFYLMNCYGGKRKKYLYGYPKNYKGYINVYTWEDLLKLTDSIIFISEIQHYIKLYDRKANIELMELLGFMAQYNNTLIFDTQLSQFITRGVEASIQTWLIKQLDIQTLKNGCKIKRILEQMALPCITSKGIILKQMEYIAFDSSMSVGFNGIHTFKFQGVGKDWRNNK